MIAGIRATGDGVVVAGSFKESLSLGASALTSAGERDVFVARLGPLP